MKIVKEQLKNIYKNRIISGVGDGEKVILSQKFDHLLFLCSDFVSAGKIKRGLEGFGKKIEIISSSRENDDEQDANLLPFSSALNRYLLGSIDGLIFLPSSLLLFVRIDCRNSPADRSLHRMQPVSVKFF